MSDPLADRLKRLAEEHAKGQQAEQDHRNFQERVNSYISDNAQKEYDNLIALLKKRVEEVNPTLGDLPKFDFGNYAGPAVVQAKVAVYVRFDKPILNDPRNALLISFASAPNLFYIDDSYRPDPVRLRLHAAAADDLSHMVWTGDLGEIESNKLADVILEQLTTYYFKNKRV